MTKRFMSGLILIGIAVLVLIFNAGGDVSINLLVAKISVVKSVAFFVFLGAGVVIGILLR